MKVSDFTVPAYKRSQVDWTLWEVTHGRQIVRPPETIGTGFRHRIKRLLDIDAEIVKSDTLSVHAFSETAPGGQGVDRLFSLLDILSLGVAFQLLDTGLNQKEVVFLLQHTRGFLKGHFSRLSIYPVCGSEKLAEKTKTPQLPETLDGKHADTKAFMVITKIELIEIYSSTYKGDGPIILSPKMCWGTKELAAFIDKEAYRYPNHIVIEIAQLCAWLQNEIHNAPITKRGRKAESNKKGSENG